MQLRFIEKGSRMTLQVSRDDLPMEFNGYFFEQVDDMGFFVESQDLYTFCESGGLKASVKVSFFRAGGMYAFTGRLRGTKLLRGQYLTQIEQISVIDKTTRRKDHRDEMRFDVSLYGITQANLQQGIFEKASQRPEFSCATLDVSAGGLCLVSNENLVSPFEPYFLSEFVLNEKDLFLLPSQLVRRGNCPQTVLYRHDYGIMFLFDHIPDEKKRLSVAIFKAKLAVAGRL